MTKNSRVEKILLTKKKSNEKHINNNRSNQPVGSKEDKKPSKNKISESKVILCDTCGTEMEQNHCVGSFGVNATIIRCPKCNYQYEIGFRYNPFLNKFVKYYKFI